MKLFREIDKYPQADVKEAARIKEFALLLQNEFKKNIKIVYGDCNNAVSGNMVKKNYYSYQTIIPDMEILINDLYNMEYGKIKNIDIHKYLQLKKL